MAPLPAQKQRYFLKIKGNEKKGEKKKNRFYVLENT